jgi:hypothetical protein
MSPFFDELESQLRAAAQAQTGARAVARETPRTRRRRRRWLPARAALAPVLATLVVIAVVGAALVLLGHGRPQPSPPSASPPPHGGLAALIAKTPQKQLRQEFAYLAAATKHVLSSKACQVQQPSNVSFVHGAPDRTLLSILGVLRRPATPADRLNPGVFVGIPEVYAGSARRAFSAAGETYYLAVAPYDRAASVPSDRCFTLQERALATYAPKIPAALRAPTKELQAGYMAWDLSMFTHGPRDSICLVDVGRNDAGASCGIAAAEIKNGASPEDNNGVYIGVVPDGVGWVRLSFPASRGRPAHSVTGIVRGNIYAIPSGSGSGSGPAPQPTVTWLSPQRRVLKTIPVPTQAEIRAACRQQPVPCALFQDGGLSQTSTSTSVSKPSPAPSR